MKRTHKALLSSLLVLISFSCFLFMPPSRSQTVTNTFTISAQQQQTEEIVTQFSNIAKFLEWIGIGALVLAAWLWRRELGITQLGPIGGTDTITQQEAGSPPKPADESGPPPSLDLSAVSAEMADAKSKQRLEHIMQMFQKVHSVNARYVAQELGVSVHTAKTYLYLLTKSGQLRADGFPKNTIYTPSQSLENRLLDAVRRRLSETCGILSERRYVRIRRMYEVDAMLESEETTFLVEAKILLKSDVLSRLDDWIPRLLNVAKEFASKRAVCVLAVACMGDVDAYSVRKEIASFTFDSGTVPVQVLVFSEMELPK